MQMPGLEKGPQPDDYINTSIRVVKDARKNLTATIHLPPFPPPKSSLPSKPNQTGNIINPRYPARPPPRPPRPHMSLPDIRIETLRSPILDREYSTYEALPAIDSKGTRSSVLYTTPLRCSSERYLTMSKQRRLSDELANFSCMIPDLSNSFADAVFAALADTLSTQGTSNYRTSYKSAFVPENTSQQVIRPQKAKRIQVPSFHTFSRSALHIPSKSPVHHDQDKSLLPKNDREALLTMIHNPETLTALPQHPMIPSGRTSVRNAVTICDNDDHTVNHVRRLATDEGDSNVTGDCSCGIPRRRLIWILLTVFVTLVSTCGILGGILWRLSTI